MNIEEAIKKFPTPFYLYDNERINHNYSLLKIILPPKSSIYYSVKANPSFGICKSLSNIGADFEVASGGELYTVLQAGISPNRIIFTSPGKTVEEITFAVKSKIHIINVESFDELELIDQIAASNNTIVNVSLRINPDEINSSSAIKMSGVASQFGISQKDITEQSCRFMRFLKNVHLKVS